MSSSSGLPPFETILKLCRQAAPEPWFPAEFAATMGADLRRLEGPLDDLRSAGLIEPADLERGRGQGFRLTRLGESALEDPQALAALRGRRAAVDDEEIEPAERPKQPSPAVKGQVLAALGNDAKPYVTYFLFAINVAVFVLGLSIAAAGNWKEANVKWFFIAGNAHARHATGAVTAATIEDGQWWRLLTSPFVHQDFFHLLINMSTFLAYGRRGEQIWGRWRYLLVYLLSAVTGGCVTLWRDPSVSPIGASPAVCGVLLSLAAWFILNGRHLPRGIERQGAQQMVMAFVWLVAWWGLLSWLGGAKFLWVSFTAGGIAGALLAIPLNTERFSSLPGRSLFLVLLPIIPLTGALLVVQAKKSKPEWQVAVAVQRKQQEQGQRQAAAQVKKKGEDAELEAFNKKLMPLIIKARQFKNEKWTDIRSVCKADAGERDMAEVAETRNKLNEGIQLTRAALGAVSTAGAFEVEGVERAAIAARNYLRDQLKLLELAEKCLDAGAAWTKENQKDLDEQEESTDRTQRLFKHSLSF